jgi:hypothetical protein
MTELTRTYNVTASAGGARIAEWVVSGPDGTVDLQVAAGFFAGVFVHFRTDRYNEGNPAGCSLCGDVPCWRDAIGNDIGREVFAARLKSDTAVYDRLEALYRKEFLGGDRCGESVPQANYNGTGSAS